MILILGNHMFKHLIEEMKEATAIDEGGPSRQFLSDAWKQLHALVVCIEIPQNVELKKTPQKVELKEETEEDKKKREEEEEEEEEREKKEKEVKLFEQGESELIPIKDEQFEGKIHSYLKKKCKNYEKDSPEIQAVYEHTIVRVKDYARAIGRLLVCMN